MKKSKLTKLALLGLAHGLLLNGQVIAESESEKIESLFASNPEVFANLKGEAQNLLKNLNEQQFEGTMLASKCGTSKCESIAAGCGGGGKCGSSKGQTVAAGCGSKCGSNKGQTVAAGCGSKCGSNKGQSVAAGCGSKCGSNKGQSVAAGCGSKCGSSKGQTVAAKCGVGKCATIAQRDTATTNLQDPSKVDLKSYKTQKNSQQDDYSDDLNDQNLGYHLMTEQELLLELNDEGTSLFKSLSPEGKKLALQVASQRCNGTNECKGLNACKTDKNECAGKGSCKGQSKCAVSDKNLAVKLVVQKMAAKRAQAVGN